MVVAGVPHAAVIRRLFHFTVLALLGLAVKGALSPRPRLEVVVVEGGQRETAVEEAVLLAEAARLGWIETDPVVRNHLVKVYSEATGREDLDRKALFEEAKALGLHRTDRVVRSRLLDRARRALRTVPDPVDAVLRSHLAAHPRRFATDPRYTISLVVRTRRRHGDAWPTVVGETARTLAQGGAAPSDRLPLALQSPLTATQGRLSARLGDAVARTVAGASLGTWTGPVLTDDQAWFVRVEEVVPSRVPPLARIRAAVRADWKAEAGERRAARELDRLIDRWRVEVVTP